jgi:hypothetical protein
MASGCRKMLMRNVVADLPSPLWEAGYHGPVSVKWHKSFRRSLWVLHLPYLASCSLRKGRTGDNSAPAEGRIRTPGPRASKGGLHNERRTTRNKTPGRRLKGAPISISHTMTASTVIGISGMTMKIAPTGSTPIKVTSRTRTSRRRVNETENSIGIISTSIQIHTDAVSTFGRQPQLACPGRSYSAATRQCEIPGPRSFGIAFADLRHIGSNSVRCGD